MITIRLLVFFVFFVFTICLSVKQTTVYVDNSPNTLFVVKTKEDIHAVVSQTVPIVFLINYTLWTEEPVLQYLHIQNELKKIYTSDEIDKIMAENIQNGSIILTYDSLNYNVLLGIKSQYSLTTNKTNNNSLYIIQYKGCEHLSKKELYYRTSFSCRNMYCFSECHKTPTIVEVTETYFTENINSIWEKLWVFSQQNLDNIFIDNLVSQINTMYHPMYIMLMRYMPVQIAQAIYDQNEVSILTGINITMNSNLTYNVTFPIQLQYFNSSVLKPFNISKLTFTTYSDNFTQNLFNATALVNIGMLPIQTNNAILTTAYNFTSNSLIYVTINKTSNRIIQVLLRPGMTLDIPIMWYSNISSLTLWILIVGIICGFILIFILGFAIQKYVVKKRKTNLKHKLKISG